MVFYFIFEGFSNMFESLNHWKTSKFPAGDRSTDTMSTLQNNNVIIMSSFLFSKILEIIRSPINLDIISTGVEQCIK